jgi:hypothetical protein
MTIHLRFLAALFCLCALPALSPAGPLSGSVSESNVSESKDVTAAQVNGTWSFHANTFKIWALGHGKLQVAFDGIYEYKSPAGPTANVGQGTGVATIEGDTAVFHPDGAEEGDKITLKFTGGKLVVKQQGNCGFGHNVYADGTYKKTSTKKPNFEE